MDLQTIREQIKANLNQFDDNEKRIIILQLLNFLKDLETENEELKAQKEEIQQEVATIKEQQVSEIAIKGKIDEIIERANDEAERIKNQALKDGERHLEDIKEQARKYMLEFLDRLKDVVIELQKIDEETKTYRMHILSIFRNTLYKFADSDYHLLKIDDKEVKELIKFFRQDATLQQLSDQIMERLNKFERYVALTDPTDANIDPAEIQHYLQNVQVIDAPDVEKVSTHEKESDITIESEETVDDIKVEKISEEDIEEDVVEIEPEEFVKPLSNLNMEIGDDEHSDVLNDDGKQENDASTFAKFLDIFNQYSQKKE